MSDKTLTFIPLGGSGEIGMNFNLYGCDGKWLIVDCGMTFGDESLPGIDIILPDPDFIEDEKDNLLGILVTHGHEDHYGAISYLWKKLGCPVYTTPLVGKLLKTRLNEAKLNGAVPIHIKNPGERFNIGSFDIELIRMSHSMPEACSIALRTPYGNIVHTGDWHFDDTPLISKPSDKEALKRIGDEGVLAMIGDSTNVLEKDRLGSEADVRENLKELIGQYKGKIAVACFASNVARFESVALAAAANNREVCLVGRSLWRMQKAARDVGYLKEVDEFLTDADVYDLPDDQVLFICTGSQGEDRAALARIAAEKHSNVHFGEGDVVMFSSKVIPGNEKSVLRVQNNLATLGVDIITDKDAFIHVSGHPSQSEMAEMYDLIRPRFAVPVHGEPIHLLSHEKFANAWGVEEAFLVENGNVLQLSNEKGCDIVGSVPSGCLVLDGKRIMPMNAEILKSRKRAMYNCSAVATVIMDNKGNILGSPQVTVTGMLDPEDDDDILEELENHIKERVMKLDKKKRNDDDEVWETARLAVRRFIDRKYGKKPVTDVHLMRV
ncbi:MAG: ribonuclease J [Alphaproteobacteria bacterium]|nr:ribonuclease J [Alphaproteobacteria bacterium]